MRSTADRKADVLDALGRQKDLWLATADLSGLPHLIAVSAWWEGSQVVFRLAPVRIQAYRGYDELEGRDVMRRPSWLA